MGEHPSTWDEQARQLYREAESQTAKAFEEVVHRNAFGELLARLTENVMAVARISQDTADLAVRNLRLAGRRDVTKLATQIARTEDKLEMVLQEVERLRDELQAERAREDAGESANGDSGHRRAERSRS